MELIFHKNFEKKYQKLTPKDKAKVVKTLEKFVENPFSPSLRNHPLAGVLQGKRAISVKGNLRLIFEEIDSYVTILFLDLGTHNVVY